MAESLRQRIDTALRQVRNERSGLDVIASEMVDRVATTTEGQVRLTLRLAASDDATLARSVRQAVEGVDGVTAVRVDIEDASRAAPPAAPLARAGGASRALPVMEQPGTAAPRTVAAPTPVAYPHLGRVVAISSGKGGVGKSTVSTNLALALARTGARVGLMDADIYGPNIPRMLGAAGAPQVRDNRIVPLEAHGIKVMSIGFLVERDQPAIWRGPIIMKVITQFLRDVEWGTLDWFIVDMPPGTGDAQLSLVQATNVHAAVIVTTPQEVATGDALRGAKMFERVGVPVLGIVENMSWFSCDHCGEKTHIFGSGGGARLAAELGLPLLGRIPLSVAVQEGGDAGQPILASDLESEASQALIAIAAQIANAVSLPPR